MADAAIARREVDRRPVAVPSTAAATKPKSEGLALTFSADERARFIAAAERYDKARPETEERFAAMKEFLPLLRATHKRLSIKSAERDATDDDKARHRAVLDKLRSMVEEVREACNSHRYELRHIAFRVFAENKFVGEMTTIARENKHEDMRESALQYFIDDIAKTISTAQLHPSSATREFTVEDDGAVARVIPLRSEATIDRKQLQEIVGRKKDALLEIGVKAFFSDARQRIAEYFATAGDISRLDKMKADTKYPDTKILIGDLLGRMEKNTATTAQLVEACIAEYFGGEKPAKKDDVAMPPIYDMTQRRKKPPSDGLGGDLYIPSSGGSDYAVAQA